MKEKRDQGGKNEAIKKGRYNEKLNVNKEAKEKARH